MGSLSRLNPCFRDRPLVLRRRRQGETQQYVSKGVLTLSSKYPPLGIAIAAGFDQSCLLESLDIEVGPSLMCFLKK
jgi:hypothetical protein